MKSLLEEEDIETIKSAIKDVVRSEFRKANKNKKDDIVFDVIGLAEYLCVKESWVYKQVSIGTLPFYKIGKYTRFRKSEIDKWIESNRFIPTSALYTGSNSNGEVS